MKKNNIIVLGATGYTGQIICKLLACNKMKFSVAARSKQKIDEVFKEVEGFILKKELFDSSDTNVNLTFLNQFDLIINCIGPFNIYSKVIINYLASLGKVYLDITGEQGFLNYAYKDLEKEIIQSKSLFSFSCAFESALVCLMAEEVCKVNLKYKSIRSFYSFSSSLPSPGTRFTMKTHQHFKQYKVEEGELVSLDGTETLQSASFKHTVGGKAKGLYTPFPEIIYLHKRFTAESIGSYTLMSEFDAEMALRMKDKPLGNLDKAILKMEKSSYSGPSEIDRKKHDFFLGVESIDEAGNIELIEVKGKDMYSLTACIIVNCLKEIMLSDKLEIGIKSISELVDPNNFLKKLSNENNLVCTKNGQALFS